MKSKNKWTSKYLIFCETRNMYQCKELIKQQCTLLLFYFICCSLNTMPVIFESDEDKYYDKEDIKKYKKGSQSGIESRGSGVFLPGTKTGHGLYLPTRGLQSEGEGIIDAIINAGKTVIETLANNCGTIGQVASSVGSIVSATSNVADAVKSVKEASVPIPEKWISPHMRPGAVSKAHIPLEQQIADIN